MTTDVTAVLERLRCIRERDGTGHSEPYIWPTLLWIDNATLATPELVGVAAPADGSARVEIKKGMRAGEAADIPDSVNALTARVDDGGFRALILVVALWEHDETPRSAVTAGFRAFSSELRAAVAAHLLALNSSDPQERAQAIIEITKQVNDRVESAIKSKLGIFDVFKDIDDVIGSDILTLTALPDVTAPTPLLLGFGQEQGGRLLFYRDRNQDGTGDVADPAVIGLGGWQQFKFLFSGGNGIIYAVDQGGRLLFYRDRNRDGTGDVADPQVIGQGGWRDFLFLFSAGNGIIYAVDPAVVGPDRYEIDGRVELRPGPQIAFSRTSLDFGLLGIGEVAVHTLRISNSGLAPLVVTVPAAPGVAFSSVPLQATLLPNDGVDVKIEFSPLASGRTEASLIVTSNAPGSPHRILLKGSGRDEIPN